MILICQYDLKTIFGYQYLPDMTIDERSDALEDAPDTVVGKQAEDDYIINKCAKTAGLPARATNIMMFCNSRWAEMTRTISGDSDKFKVIMRLHTHSCTTQLHTHSFKYIRISMSRTCEPLIPRLLRGDQFGRSSKERSPAKMQMTQD